MDLLITITNVSQLLIAMQAVIIHSYLGNLQVSAALKTQALEIDLQLASPYQNYLIDVWFHHDNRFMTFPLAASASFLVTNNINFELVFATAPSNHYARFTCGATVITSLDFVNPLAWMHLVFHNYSVQNTFYFHVNHNLFATTPLAVAPFTGTSSNPRGSGSCTLSKLYFCGNPDGAVGQCGGKGWINAYYKNLRIWDGAYANVWAVMKQDQ